MRNRLPAAIPAALALLAGPLLLLATTSRLACEARLPDRADAPGKPGG